MLAVVLEAVPVHVDVDSMTDMPSSYSAESTRRLCVRGFVARR